MLTFRIGFNSFRREMPHTLEGLSIAVHHCRFIGWSTPETARMVPRICMIPAFRRLTWF